jgi:hypothetical protein
MAIVLDALELVHDKKRLPTEAFFVDTNIVLDYADPFGRSLDRDSFARRNAEAREIIHWLKSQHHQAFSTISVALEFYKVIQVGFYQIFVDKTSLKVTPTRFDPEHFKRLRKSDVDFIERWNLQLRGFRRAFTKWFPVFHPQFEVSRLMQDFDGSQVDFGDHVLHLLVLASGEKRKCVFSNDADFASYPDDFYLLTTNPTILKSRK